MKPAVSRVGVASLPCDSANERPASNASSLVVTAYQRIDPSLFQAILLGGSAVPAVRPQHVIATYGLTETGSGCVYDGWPLPGVDIRVDVNGQILLEDGKHSGALPGRVLRNPYYRANNRV